LLDYQLNLSYFIPSCFFHPISFQLHNKILAIPARCAEYHSSFSGIVSPVYGLRIFPLFASQLKGHQIRVSWPTTTPYTSRSTKHGRALFLLFPLISFIFSRNARKLCLSYFLFLVFIFLLCIYLNTFFLNIRTYYWMCITYLVMNMNNIIYVYKH
jgi:hypothetical protein